MNRGSAGTAAYMMPAFVQPMLARPGSLPARDADWAAEIKWDGYRAGAYCRGGDLELVSRNGNEISDRFPEITELGASAPGENLILDGEIVALDPEGLPDFGRLQQLFHAERTGRRPEGPGAVYMIFDVLHHAGRQLADLPYLERREILGGLDLNGPSWQTPDHARGDLTELLGATRERGLEGLVLKRLDSRYEPGMRSGAWLKVKNVRSQELVVGGWLPGEGAREGKVGALLVGAWDGEGAERRLLYMGRVGTGFDRDSLALLADRLEPLRRAHSPFATAVPAGAVHVEPELVVEVEFRELTRDGLLRHASFKGLRPDKPAGEVVPESPGGAGIAG